MKLVVKSPVWDDLREIAQYIARDNADAAERFLKATEETFKLLKSHPGLGRLRSFSIPGIRSWVIADFRNYIVFYLPTKTEVQILAVLHGARDLPQVLEGRLE
jgi:toxin ParE1/3/4